MTRQDDAPGRPDPHPLVTVGVFGYNHEDYVLEAVQSVVDSTFDSWELVIVDDGSTDATASVLHDWVRQIADPRVRLISDGENWGLASRLNEVLNGARGEWLAVLGGDDAYLPEGLATLVSRTAPGVDVVWGDLEVIDEDGLPKGYCRPRDTWQGWTARRYTQPAPPGLDLLRVNNFISGTSCLVRVEALRASGGYTAGVRNEDLDLWLRLGTTHLFRYADAPVARYRVVAGSSSRSEVASVLDQGGIAARLLQQHLYPRAGLARLVAMRWLLATARMHGRPPVSIAELAKVSGLTRREIVLQIPRAGADPVLKSVASLVRRRSP